MKSKGILIVSRSNWLQHQLSFFLTLCCCRNCLLFVRLRARYWVHTWLTSQWGNVPHQLLPCWRRVCVLVSIPPFQRPFGLFTFQVQPAPFQLCPEARGHTCFSTPNHLVSILLFSQDFLTTLKESKAAYLRFRGGLVAFFCEWATIFFCVSIDYFFFFYWA